MRLISGALGSRSGAGTLCNSSHSLMTNHRSASRVSIIDTCSQLIGCSLKSGAHLPRQNGQFQRFVPISVGIVSIPIRACARAQYGVLYNLNASGRIVHMINRPKCGAKTRAGGYCQAKVVKGRSRCRMHGGLSTGPKTASGRQRISDAQRRRWQSRPEYD